MSIWTCHLYLDWGYDTCGDALKSARARFGITGHMEYYAHADLTEIVERTADILRWKSPMRQLRVGLTQSRNSSYRQSSPQARARFCPDYGEWGYR